MKRVFLIHGWQGQAEEGWRPGLVDKLTKIGILVNNLQMPNTNFPKQEEWVKHLSKAIGTPDKDTVLIGHSLGVITILRYLETISSAKIGGAIFIAGFTNPLGQEPLENFFKTPLHWHRIKNACDIFIAIHSDNDPYVDVSFANEFKSKLGAQTIIAHNMHHFSASDGITKLPIVLQTLTSILNQ